MVSDVSGLYLYCYLSVVMISDVSDLCLCLSVVMISDVSGLWLCLYLSVVMISDVSDLCL